MSTKSEWEANHLCLASLTVDDAENLIDAVFNARSQNQPAGLDSYDRILGELQLLWPIAFSQVAEAWV